MEKYKYYKISEEKVIETVTTIPENMWERKGILPYEEIKEVIESNDLTDTEEIIDIQEKLVVKTIKKYNKPKTLDEIKEIKKLEIKEKNMINSHNGFTCINGIKLDCRENDKINWLSLKINCLHNTEFAQPIRDFYNVIHSELKNKDILDMLSELEFYYYESLSNKWQKELEVDSCNTAEEVNLIELE